MEPNTTPQPQSTFMKNKTPIFIGILILLTAVLVFMALSPARQKIQQSDKETPTSATEGKSDKASAVLSISPQPFLSSESGNFETNVDMSSGSNKVSAVQLELLFNPDEITVLDIKPGAFFSNPIELIKNIDQDRGRISYSLSSSLSEGGIDKVDTVAIISFTSKLAPGQKTSIEFLPKTAVTAAGEAQSVLSEAKSAELDFDAATDTEPEPTDQE